MTKKSQAPTQLDCSFLYMVSRKIQLLTPIRLAAFAIKNTEGRYG